MRVFIRATEAEAIRFLAEGFFANYCDAALGAEGVRVAAVPPGGMQSIPVGGFVIEGPLGESPFGEVILCLDLPEKVFRKFEVQEGARPLSEKDAERHGLGVCPPDMEFVRMGYAIIPIDELNRHGKPNIWDHPYAGSSRKEMLDAIKGWEVAGEKFKAQEMRNAIEFLDKIGWQTPLRFKEESEEAKADSGEEE